jgi:hypothetical protein
MRVPFSQALTVDPDLIALPNYSHLDVQSLGTQIIPFSDIYIDDLTGNTTKVETHTAAEIEALRISFATGGLITSEFPPAVVRQPEGSALVYKLVYGYGRCESLQELLQDRWFFTVLEGSEEALLDVKATENEEPPKRINKEIDMKKYLMDKVTRGIISNTEDAIARQFKKVYPGQPKVVQNRVVQMVTYQADTPIDFIQYTSVPRVKQWIANHATEEIKVDGEFDTDRDMYGVVCKEGYQYRSVLHAAKRYRESGKKTYVVGHFGPLTKNATIYGKREKFVKEFDDIKDALENLGMTTWPIVVLGYLPQIPSEESLKHLVDPYPLN